MRREAEAVWAGIPGGMDWHVAMSMANRLAACYGLPFRVYSIRHADGRWEYDVAPIPASASSPPPERTNT